MTTSEDLRAGAEAEVQPPQPEAAPQRHTDWISYAAAVAQPEPPTAEFLSQIAPRNM